MGDTTATDADEWPGKSRRERRTSEFQITFDPDRVVSYQDALNRQITLTEMWWLNRTPWIPATLLDDPRPNRGESE